eukprot:13301711-Ditylum_brightwellii.AAC.1
MTRKVEHPFTNVGRDRIVAAARGYSAGISDVKPSSVKRPPRTTWNRRRTTNAKRKPMMKREA